MAINVHLGRFVAPMIVGPALAFGEALTAFFASACLYGVMIVLLPFINVGDQGRALKEWSGWSKEFATGFRFATGHPVVVPVFLSFLLLSVFGVAALALSAAPNFWIAVALTTIAAFAATASTISGVSVIQTSVPDEIRGRVMGIYGTLYRAAPAVGAIAMGWASDFVGLRWPIAIGATVCLVWWLGIQITKPRLEAGTEGGD